MENIRSRNIRSDVSNTGESEHLQLPLVSVRTHHRSTWTTKPLQPSFHTKVCIKNDHRKKKHGHYSIKTLFGRLNKRENGWHLIDPSFIWKDLSLQLTVFCILSFLPLSSPSFYLSFSLSVCLSVCLTAGYARARHKSGRYITDNSIDYIVLLSGKLPLTATPQPVIYPAGVANRKNTKTSKAKRLTCRCTCLPLPDSLSYPPV